MTFNGAFASKADEEVTPTHKATSTTLCLSIALRLLRICFIGLPAGWAARDSTIAIRTGTREQRGARSARRREAFLEPHAETEIDALRPEARAVEAERRLCWSLKRGERVVRESDALGRIDIAVDLVAGSGDVVREQDVVGERDRSRRGDPIADVESQFGHDREHGATVPADVRRQREVAARICLGRSVVVVVVGHE